MRLEHGLQLRGTQYGITPIRHESTTIHYLADLLFRQRFLIVSLLLLIVGSGAIYWFTTPDTYRAEVEFLIKNSRPAPQIDGPYAAYPPQAVTDSQISTEVEILDSWEIMSAVVERANLVHRQEGESQEQALETAVEQLQRNLDIKPGVRTATIAVAYEGSSSEEALTVLEALSEIYQQRHLALHENSSSGEFFEEQSEQYQQELEEAQQELTEFELRTRVVALDAQKDQGLRDLSALQGELNRTDARREELNQRIIALQSQIENTPRRITTQSRELPNQYAIERLNTLLVELRNHRSELRANFRDDDRMVVQIEEQIQQTEIALKEAGESQVIEQATDVNPTRLKLENELADARTEVSGLSAKRNELAVQIAHNNTGLARLSSSTGQRSELERRVNEAERLYLLYSHQSEEARVSAAMDRERISNIAILQAPRLPVRPQQKASLNFVFGLLLAMGVALALVILRGMQRHDVFTPWELELIAELPVLGAIPEGAPRKEVQSRNKPDQEAGKAAAA